MQQHLNNNNKNNSDYNEEGHFYKKPVNQFFYQSLV